MALTLRASLGIALLASLLLCLLVACQYTPEPTIHPPVAHEDPPPGSATPVPLTPNAVPSSTKRNSALPTSTIPSAESRSPRSSTSDGKPESEVDRAALVDLFNATGGPTWTRNFKWLSDSPLDEWYGVKVDASGRVVSLHLHQNNLRGRLPAAMGSLSKLEELTFYQNQLTGDVPPELGNLSNLVSLSLTLNQLSGEIPAELGRLVNLEWMDLGGNKLRGTVPEEIGELAILSTLALWDNQLTGCLPAKLRTSLIDPSIAVLPFCVSVEGQRPDLIATASIRGGNVKVQPGSHVAIDIKIRNNGPVVSPPTILRIFPFVVSNARQNRGEIWEAVVHPMPASGAEWLLDSYSYDAPYEPGIYRLTVCIEAVPEETNTTDNCATPMSVEVIEDRHPDLVVNELRIHNLGDALYVGQAFELLTEIENVGNEPSEITTLRYRLYHHIDNTQYDLSPVDLGIARVESAGPDHRSPHSIQLNWPPKPGKYSLGACVDSVAREINISNNCWQGPLITVKEAPIPDLRPEFVSIGDGDGLLEEGIPFQLRAKVFNEGGGPSGPTTLRMYLSRDDILTARDPEVGSVRLGIIPESQSIEKAIELTPPSTEDFLHYALCVEAVSQEFNTENNCIVAGAAIVVEHIIDGPDLQVRGWIREPDRELMQGGQSFEFNADVINAAVIGFKSSSFPGGDATTLWYYLSYDDIITPRDQELGSDRVRPLGFPDIEEHSIWLNAPDRSGTYYYGACVDSFAKEVDSTNNCSDATQLTVVGGANTDSSRPARVTARAIEEVGIILDDAESGSITESQAQSRLFELSKKIGKPAMQWIVSNTPVWDRKTGEFVRFENWAEDFVTPYDPDNPSRFETDPVGTAIDLVFGTPSTNTILEWLGFGD